MDTSEGILFHHKPPEQKPACCRSAPERAESRPLIIFKHVSQLYSGNQTTFRISRASKHEITGGNDNDVWFSSGSCTTICWSLPQHWIPKREMGLAWKLFLLLFLLAALLKLPRSKSGGLNFLKTWAVTLLGAKILNKMACSQSWTPYKSYDKFTGFFSQIDQTWAN